MREERIVEGPLALRPLIQHYYIQYTYLIAGEPSQLKQRIAQAENVNAEPSTFFVGRDGLVHGVFSRSIQTVAIAGSSHRAVQRKTEVVIVSWDLEACWLHCG